MQMHTARSMYDLFGITEPRPTRWTGWAVLARVRLAVADLAAAIARHRHQQKAYDELMAMDDRLLADIGLSRPDIENAVRFGGPSR